MNFQLPGGFRGFRSSNEFQRPLFWAGQLLLASLQLGLLAASLRPLRYLASRLSPCQQVRRTSYRSWRCTGASLSARPFDLTHLVRPLIVVPGVMAAFRSKEFGVWSQ